MKFALITLFPETKELLSFGVIGRALKQELIEIQCFNPRDFSTDKHKRVDDSPYGGGHGMVMQVQPLQDAIHAAKKKLGADTPVVYLSPQGKTLHQNTVERFSKLESLILLCGRYEGIDERLITLEVDEEISIGDYILSGGELPACVTIDAVSRLIPGVLGEEQSALEDSFSQGLLEHAHYTRPPEISGLTVPQVLQSGDHEAIKRERFKDALGRTYLRRPDLIEKKTLTTEEQFLLKEFITEHAK